MPLDPDVAMLITEIDANSSHVESIAHGLTRAQSQWRPEPGRWSIGECIAHLNAANGINLPEIEEGIAKARARGLMGAGPFRYGFLMRKFTASQEPPVTKKHRAPKSMVPPADVDLDATLGEYRRISGELKRLTRDADGLHLEKVKLKLRGLPALPRAIVRVPLGGWLGFITTHDRRHLWQAEQVKNDPGFPYE